MCEANRFSFSNLFLLVGTNPLPDFVVTEYFLKNNPALTDIHLIYSEKTNTQSGTKDYADALREIIRARHNNRNLSFHLIPLSDVALPSQIKADLRKELDKKSSVNIEAHLNYTGGTKAMGIHVYQFLREVFNTRISFSYFDARTFQIVSDDKDRITGDLRKEIKINVDELIKLHGFERTGGGKDNIDFSKAISVFKDLVDNDRLDEYFKNYKRELFVKKEGKENLICKLNEVSDNLKNHKAEGEFLSVVLSMPTEYQLFNQKGVFVEPKANKQLEKAIKFLDGGWLELYVFEVLKNCFKEGSPENQKIFWGDSNDSVSLELNLEIKKSDWTGNQKFELDVVIINGYQLIGISCTTSEKRHICKSKGFEIFMRTRQIGGEEAKAVLITRLSDDNVMSIEKELQLDTGSGDNLIVLGKRDLKSDIICEKIQEELIK